MAFEGEGEAGTGGRGSLPDCLKCSRTPIPEAAQLRWGGAKRTVSSPLAGFDVALNGGFSLFLMILESPQISSNKFE